MARSAPTFLSYIGNAIPGTETKESRKERASFVKNIAEQLGVTPRTIQRKITVTGTQKRGQGEKSKGLSSQEKQAANKYVGSVAKRTGTEGIGHNPNAKDRVLQINTYRTKELAEARAAQQIEDANESDVDGDESPTLMQHAAAVRVRFIPEGASYPQGWGSRAQTVHAPVGGLWAVEAIGN